MHIYDAYGQQKALTQSLRKAERRRVQRRLEPAMDAIATITCLGAGFMVGQIPDEPIAPWIGSVILVTGLIFAVSLLSTYLKEGKVTSHAPRRYRTAPASPDLLRCVHTPAARHSPYASSPAE